MNEDDIERRFSLKECELAIKEHELEIKEHKVKIRALELANIEKEKELGL